MLKRLLTVGLLVAAPICSAQAATIVLLPEPGSMSPATVIVDPRASRHDPLLVCSSLAQLSAGACMLQSRAAATRPRG